MFRLFFYPIADSFTLVAFVGAGAGGLLLVRPARGDMNVRRRMVLSRAAAAVIGLVVLAMLRPTLVYTETKKEKATLVLLIDQIAEHVGARRPGRQDPLGRPARRLDDAAPALRELARDFEVKAYAFDSRSIRPRSPTARSPCPKSPRASETAIGAALADVLRQEAGKRLLGVILLSDGAQRALAPRDLPPQIAAA